MAISIDNYLRILAANYYLKNNSAEVAKINTSVASMRSNLQTYLGAKMNRSFIFGSFDRDTILPRSIDQHSDVDVMVVFNHTDFERTPETYRSWLHDFAKKYYQERYGSSVSKTHPTVTIRLNNIHYDLVPAKEEVGFWNSTKTLYIPKAGGNWRSTNPNDVKSALTNANMKYNGIVRPVIRLMKAWNCSNGYPYDSYDLERALTGMNFSGDNYERGLFYAVEQLPLSRNDSLSTKSKVDSLKTNIANVKSYLSQDNMDRAKHWLHRVLPYAC